MSTLISKPYTSGKTTRYTNSDSFAVMFETFIDWDGKFKSEGLWNNRVYSSGKGYTEAQAITRSYPVMKTYMHGTKYIPDLIVAIATL